MMKLKTWPVNFPFPSASVIGSYCSCSAGLWTAYPALWIDAKDWISLLTAPTPQRWKLIRRMSTNPSDEVEKVWGLKA